MSNLLKDNKKLMKQWDYDKNSNLDINTIKLGSRHNAWWICDKGHSYNSRIESRTRGSECPYCSNHKVLMGFNDVGTLYPKILDEWDYENNNILPSDVTIGSGKNVNFVCSKGHKYNRTIRDYCRGYGCPICSNRIIVSGINDFASYDKRLMSEWNYKKNGKLDPKKISPNYTKKVWWIGECRHEWQASVYSRTKMGTNCPICAEERHASVSEKTVLYYLNKSNAYKKILENYKDDKINLELDIYIPEIKTAIEYDGERWHKNVNKDLRKDIMCKNNNIRIIRLRECGCPDYKSNSYKIFLKNNKINGLEEAILKLLNYLSVKKVDINIDRDNSEILSMINFMVKENSILKLFPEIAKEWHPIKNGNLKPEHTKPSSNKLVWWLCPKGHEYQLDVYHRTGRCNGCPYCSSHRVLKGFNDLEILNPNLASEWNYKKNKITPADVTCGSSKKVWWLCSKGHEWEATISKRNSGRGCPYCSGQRVLRGFNDFATIMPELLKEWNYNKNTDIYPTELSAHSGRKVWWKCKNCGYEWQATVDKRSNGRNCPACSRIIVQNKRMEIISKPVVQMDQEGNIINEYPSIREAIRKTKCTKIDEVIKGKNKTAGEYIWKLKK